MSYALQSEVMSRAAELRDEGLDRSEALSEAWSEVEDDDEGGIMENPITGGQIGWLGIAAAAFGIWCLVRKSITPWRTSATVQRLLQRGRSLRTVYPARPDEKVNNFTSVLPVPGGNNRSDEQISIIHP